MIQTNLIFGYSVFIYNTLVSNIQNSTQTKKISNNICMNYEPKLGLTKKIISCDFYTNGSNLD